MLNMNEKIIITGESIIDGVSVEGYQAQIDSTNPYDISFSSWHNNKALYKINRVACREDQAAFEDYAYSRQDEMIANMTINEENTTE